MAGLGSECSHIAALLFKLEAAVHYNLNEQAASTSQLCAWKTSRKFVTPAPLSAIDFSRPKKQSLPPAAKKKVPNKHFSCYDPASGSNEKKERILLHCTIVTRESCSLEANNALLFYLFVNIFLVPSLLEGASNFCEGAKDMAERTHAAGYDQKILVL